MEDEELEYYVDLFEHRRQVQEIYNQPIVGGWTCLILVFLIGLYVVSQN